MTNQQAARTETSVLVVGGALTGLSAALFLAWHGVSTVVVERHPDLLLHPRLRGINPRSVELFGQVGLDRAIREASYVDATRYAWQAIRAETLADDEYGRLDEGEGGGTLDAASPALFGQIDQDRLELLLRARARELGADIRFGVELLSFESDETAVTARLGDATTDAPSEIRANYLIAADGANSPIRRRLGIGVDGPGMLYDTVTAIVRADLRPALRGRQVDMAYLRQPRPFTILMPHDRDGTEWIFATGYDSSQESLADFTDEQIAAMVRTAAGLPDVDVTSKPQIPGTDTTVLGFGIGAQVAREFRHGRVFLAGDAARINPPTGGLGGNTGIQDAHNLAWKLAAVLRGYAGVGLLDSYDAERRSTAAMTMWQAFARFGSRMGDGAEVELLDYDAVAMGYRYASSAVLGASAETAPVPPLRLSGEPGTRAPHVEIPFVGKRISTIQLYGEEFVLLTGPEGAEWRSAAVRVSDELSVPLLIRELPDAESANLHGLSVNGALLVRPDGFVAWRTPNLVDDPGAELRAALRAVLAVPGGNESVRPTASAGTTAARSGRE